MPARDPQTGQFISAGGMDRFDDVEVANFGANVGIEASNMDGTTSFTGENTSFEGLELLDYDEIVDRNEELHLLQAQHRLVVWQNSTTTEDGQISGAVEIAADPSVSNATVRAASPSTNTVDGDVVGQSRRDDTIDIIGRILTAVSYAPFSDTTNGVGGAGGVGEDDYTTTVFPAETARFHPRDELFLNGRFQATNVSDAGIHMSVSGQHVYGVVTE